MGKGRAEAARPADAAARIAASRRSHARVRAERARSVARQRRGSGAESRPHRYLPASQPHRISQRHPRSARARGGRGRAAAERFCELRLRQHYGRQPLADLARELRVGGGKNQPARRRPPEPVARRLDRPHSTRCDAGDAPRRVADRNARRRARVARVSRQRRIRHHDSAVARSQRAHRGAARAARHRAARRRRARATLHRRAPITHDRPVVGGLGLARDARQPHEDSCARHRRTACPRRDVPEEAIAAARDGASALRGALQLLPASAPAAGRLRDLDHRPVQSSGPARRSVGEGGRHSQPAPRFHMRAADRRVREDDSLDAHEARVPSARGRCRSEKAARAVCDREGREWIRGGHRDGIVRGAREPRVPVPH